MAQPAQLEPYTARYQVSYRGIAGGYVESSLRPAAPAGTWQYATRAFPNFLGRMALSADAHEHSTMQISADGVRPLEFEFDDGSAEDAKDIRVQFDWSAGLARGVADGKPFEYEVEPGTQDTASVQAAMLVELLAGRAPEGFPILTGGRLRQYRYWSEGQATVTTPAGQYDTVVWVSQREGSSRVQRVWHAPELGYVPVQAIQYRKGKPELAMKLASLTRQ
ncbi:MAG TPA: DUF3108 domain-containing protein [Burkholderiales bacterium]|nr:DUF3108 domain-containing protein [Burkholderiales bacterium]